MGIKNETQYTKSDRFIKVANDELEIPKFFMYNYKTPDTVDFDKVISEGKKINGKLFEVYSKDKEFEGKKYKIYGFIFEDNDGVFNISVSEKVMQTRVNKLIDSDLTKEVEISVFASPSKDGDKVYRNFAFRQEGQLLNARISSQDKRDLVKETTNAAGEVTKDFSLISKTFKDMFEELKEKLVDMQSKELKIEDLETEAEFGDVNEVFDKMEKKEVSNAIKEKEKMIKDEDLPF